MSIRIRTVDGVRIALCAAETDPVPGDVYLDDGEHYALTAKFVHDHQGQTIDWIYPVEWAAMASQRKRDATEELNRWLAEVEKQRQAEDWPGERCKSCGRRNAVGFTVPDEVWAAVAGEFSVLCTTCFDELAQQKGVTYSFGALYPVSWSEWRKEP